MYDLFGTNIKINFSGEILIVQMSNTQREVIYAWFLNLYIESY
jgi:hypothetical protein